MNLHYLSSQEWGEYLMMILQYGSLWIVGCLVFALGSNLIRWWK